MTDAAIATFLRTTDRARLGGWQARQDAETQWFLERQRAEFDRLREWAENRLDDIADAARVSLGQVADRYLADRIPGTPTARALALPDPGDLEFGPLLEARRRGAVEVARRAWFDRPRASLRRLDVTPEFEQARRFATALRDIPVEETLPAPRRRRFAAFAARILGGFADRWSWAQ